MGMATRRTAALLLFGTLAAVSGDVFACGDKFLVVSRNTRFKRANAPRTPADVLIYAAPNSNVPRALADVPVDATLRKAGYRSTSVASPEELERALAEGRWDVILADEAECEKLRGRLPADAMLVPVFYRATSAQVKQAKKAYPCILESPTKSQALLETIDDAMALKPRPTAPGTGRTTS